MAACVLQANNSRDALARSLYGRQFAWLVARLNKSLHREGEVEARTAILDIFGFESFQVRVKIAFAWLLLFLSFLTHSNS